MRIVALGKSPAAPQPAAKEPPRSVSGSSLPTLSNIYDDDVNLAVWRRDLPEVLRVAVAGLVPTLKPGTTHSGIVRPADAAATAARLLDVSSDGALAKDLALLVDLFCCLLDLEQANLRLSTLTSTMCPRFHVDRVHCRLLTTYSGPGTEWLPEQTIDRSKLGLGAGGKPDDRSGIYRSVEDVQGMTSGDVALLKGEDWPGNENRGLVHRSPAVGDGAVRLVLTLDKGRSTPESHFLYLYRASPAYISGKPLPSPSAETLCRRLLPILGI